MNGEVLIVDEHTGRMLAGRRYNDGMHQAIEAKEGVQIQEREPDAGDDHPAELLPHVRQARRHDRHRPDRGRRARRIYKVDVVPIPTNKPMIRIDQPDLVYRTEEAKFDAVVDDIVERHERASRSSSAPSRSRRASTSRPSCVAAGPARGPQRQAPRARGRDRRRRRPQGCRHRRDEHGRPRHRHHARRQPEFRAVRAQGTGLDPSRRPRVRSGLGRARCPRPRPWSRRARRGQGCWRPLRPGHRAPRVAASTTSCVVVRSSGRPGRVRFYLAPGHLMRLFNADMVERVHEHRRPGRRCADRVQDGLALHPVRAEPGRGAELRDPQERPQVRRRPQPPAHRHLRRASPRARGRGPEEQRATSSTTSSRATSTPRPPRLSRGLGPRPLWDRPQKGLYPISVTPDQLADAAGGLAVSRPSGSRRRSSPTPTRPTTPARPRWARRSCVRSSAASCCSVLDRKWREHLYEMDYLQEGIGLRAPWPSATRSWSTSGRASCSGRR